MDKDEIKIGKHLLDVLTIGMYQDPIIIYREYIQNSVDAIEACKIKGIFDNYINNPIYIEIKKQEKAISIYDTGIGLKSSLFYSTLTSIAASTKKIDSNIGFRGIGRLAGIAYCSTLTMKSSYYGENTASILRWDAQKIRDSLRADKMIEAIDLINNTTESFTEKEDTDKHYFEVILSDVNNQELLEEQKVIEYISQVCPVEFDSKFVFKTKIRNFLDNYNLKLKEYYIIVNKKEVKKNYGTDIYKIASNKKKKHDEIVDINHFVIYNDSKIIAFCWYALTRKLQLIPKLNYPGIKFRQNNFQIGRSDVLRELFEPQERFVNYFIGELHIFENTIIPNAQRNYFEDSPEFRFLMRETRKYIKDLNSLCKLASDINSLNNASEDYNAQKSKYDENKQTNSFINKKHEESSYDALVKTHEELEKKRNDLDHRIERISSKIVKDGIKKVYPPRISTNTIITNESQDNHEKKKYAVSDLSKLDRKEKKLLSKVFAIINETMTSDVAENLIFAIKMKLK